jgi:hypothetical protein
MGLTRAQLRALQAISEERVRFYKTPRDHYVTLAPRGQRCRSDVVQRLVDEKLARVRLGGYRDEGAVVLTPAGRAVLSGVPA